MDIENVLGGYAKLFPSYRKEQDLTHNATKTQQAKNKSQKKKKSNTENSEAQASSSGLNSSPQTEKIEQAVKAEKVKYVPDMSEPRTYLNTVFQSVLQLRIPSELGQELRRRLKIQGDKSDYEILQTIGFVDKGKIKSKYRVELFECAISIVYITEKNEEVRVSGPALRFFIFTVCSLILDDLSQQLRDPKVWQSVLFSQLSKKMIWNPFYKVAALIPLTQPGFVPPVLGLLLMDNRLSLMTMSFMLRSASISVTLKDKYDNIEYNQDESVIKGIEKSKYGDITYSFLVANGTYDYIRVKWSDVLRDITPRSSRVRKTIKLSDETCSW